MTLRAVPPPQLFRTVRRACITPPVSRNEYHSCANVQAFVAPITAIAEDFPNLHDLYVLYQRRVPPDVVRAAGKRELVDRLREFVVQTLINSLFYRCPCDIFRVECGGGSSGMEAPVDFLALLPAKERRVVAAEIVLRYRRPKWLAGTKC